MTTPAFDTWGDRFGDAERALLAPFVTDLDAPIFGLRNLPEVVKGALFSRYSRTDKSLRRILLDEFIQAPESGFAAIVGAVRDAQRAPGGEQIVAVRQAEAFYERVLIGYSPLEKSTRYVVFNRKVEGRYRYLREPRIMESRHAVRYEAALDSLFDTYSTLLEPTIAAVRARTPRDEATSERAYNSATRAKACDLLRGLLPMATLTNVGLFGNGRAFEYLLTRLYAAPLAELPALAAAMQEALDSLIPSFVKRAKSERGRAYQRYLSDVREQVVALIGDQGSGIRDQELSRLVATPDPRPLTP